MIIHPSRFPRCYSCYHTLLAASLSAIPAASPTAYPALPLLLPFLLLLCLPLLRLPMLLLACYRYCCYFTYRFLVTSLLPPLTALPSGVLLLPQGYDDTQTIWELPSNGRYLNSVSE